MEEEIDKNEVNEKTDKTEVFSRAVRAGKRTYFFDVKLTRRNDNFLTITESKKRYQKDGRYYFEKHKIYLYKEDFEKFMKSLRDAINFVESFGAEPLYEDEFNQQIDTNDMSYTDVEFEDLESVELTERKPSENE